MKCNGSQRLDLNDINDSSNFNLVPPAGQTLSLSRDIAQQLLDG